MKKLERKIFCTLAMLAIFSFTVHAGSFYVVIASFTHESSARQFSQSITDVFAEASMRFDKNQDVYHVFVMETNDAKEAEDYRKHLQEISGLRNAWIFTEGVGAYTSYVPEQGSSSDLVTLELYTGSSVLLSSSDNGYLAIAKNKGEVRQTTNHKSAKAFSFISRTHNGHLLPARVRMFDPAGNQISIFKANEVVGLNGKNRLERVMLVCDLRGYSTETKIIDLSHPGNTVGIHQNQDGVWEVNFNMSRVRADQVRFVYRDLFHPDASVAQPCGKKNIEVLLALLRSNPDWRIVINSHTDAGHRRQIAFAASEDIFDTTLARFKEGSDKELTRERAQALQSYLTSGGIDKKQITVMGWGSLAKVSHSGHKNGHLNDRIEVELLMD